MSVKIIVDSTADMTPQVKARVKVVPLTIRFGDREYVDGVDMDSVKFYTMLAESQQLPTTSQAGPFAFEEAFAEAVEAGFEVVCITCSGKLSGTNQSATIAAAEYPGKVHVVDSNTIALGLGILTDYALQLVDRGLSAEEITWKLLQKREKICLLAMLDTLEYLKKGGRISATAAFAGGLLNIKPVIAIADGEIRVLGKARGTKQGNSLLVQEIGKAGGVDHRKPLMLGYTGVEDTLLHKFVDDSASLWENSHPPATSAVGSVVGTHAGPGAVAVAFFRAEG